MVVASDVSHFYENIMSGWLFTTAFHVGQMLEGFDRLFALAPSHPHMVSGHDPEVMRRYPAPWPDYVVPTPAFQAGLAREPDIVGCDMGSIDIGPYYLGAGQMATAPAATRRDLRKVILAARQHDIPLVIGSAGSAGARPHGRDPGHGARHCPRG